MHNEPNANRSRENELFATDMIRRISIYTEFAELKDHALTLLGLWTKEPMRTVHAHRPNGRGVKKQHPKYMKDLLNGWMRPTPMGNIRPASEDD